MKDKIKYMVTVMVLLSLSMTMGISAELRAGVRQATLQIETTDYGQVAEKIKASGVTQCDTLKIAGYMDKSDFTAVREFVPDAGNCIEMLDLREASLKGNEVPDSALCRKQKYPGSPRDQVEPVLLKIRNILLPEGIVRIGDSSLCEMELKTVNIPSSVREIGESAFSDDRHLDCELVIPYGVDRIKGSVFAYCRSLKTAPRLPETIKFIGTWAFYGCGFEEISLPEGLVELGNFAFSHSSLKKVKLPATCTAVVEECFSECHNLEELDMKAASIKFIVDYLAAGCDKLRILRLPRNLDSMLFSPFIGCRNLQIVEVGEGTKKIDWGYVYSPTIESVTLPSTIQTLQSFEDFPKLTTVFCKAQTPPKFTNGQGSLVTNVDKATLYVPQGTKDAYAAADGWKDFARIEEVAEFPDAGVSPCLPDNVIDDNNLYDLEGRKVQYPVPGRIYIRNGEKIKL